MTRGADDPKVEDGVFQREVERVARVVGIPVPAVAVRRKQAGRAAALRGRHGAVVRVGRDTLEAPVEVQRFIAAHEVGHIALGHVYRRRAAELSAAAGLIAVGLVLAALHISTFPDTHPAVATVVPAAAAGALVVLLMSYVPARRCERAADVFACQAGSPLTPTVAEWMMGQRRQPRLTPTWMLDHPKWPDRLRHACQQTDTDGP
jgi:Zn-dependent protease with chaperone function